MQKLNLEGDLNKDLKLYILYSLYYVNTKLV
jgi:hypothetical protein